MSCLRFCHTPDVTGEPRYLRRPRALKLRSSKQFASQTPGGPVRAAESKSQARACASWFFHACMFLGLRARYQADGKQHGWRKGSARKHRPKYHVNRPIYNRTRTPPCRKAGTPCRLPPLTDPSWCGPRWGRTLAQHQFERQLPKSLSRWVFCL